ncbi:hypothetical protein CWS20_13120 [Cytobacillus horneckiae]|uniref:Uncharacterized protein n=1 Tax=Cytobacillus horneckiae TaxID=549687 RepID=A0A2N0ZG84_9BACI|nr:hypothetical protein CWS20_13120 [Cytobacillus horneckiae]
MNAIYFMHVLISLIFLVIGLYAFYKFYQMFSRKNNSKHISKGKNKQKNFANKTNKKNCVPSIKEAFILN